MDFFSSFPYANVYDMFCLKGLLFSLSLSLSLSFQRVSRSFNFTQAFKKAAIPKLLNKVKERGSNFDMRLLLELFNEFGIAKETIRQFPLFFIEDFAASAFSKAGEPGGNGREHLRLF